MSTQAPPEGLSDTHLAPGTFSPQQLVLDGRFRIERLLGGGGMGLVYLAEQVSLGRQVALKVLRDDLLTTQGMSERFRREALLLSSVDHPSVVRVIDFGEHGRSLCLVMEYVEGQSLQQCLEHEAPLPIARVERIVTQLAQGLAAIHARGIVHRDLKPDNVVLTKSLDGSEQARVLDFGIARLAEPDQRQQVTQVGFVVGTPEYMSPEQAMGQPLDARSDLYALGLIAWRLLTGRAPFPGPSARELVSQQIHSPPPSLLEAAPHLSVAPALVETVMACLQKNPAARPPTAQAFLERLEARPIPLTHTLTGAMRVQNAPTRLLARAKVAPRWTWWLGALLVLAAAGGLLAWYFEPVRVARRLVDGRRGSEALQVIDDASGDAPGATMLQLKAAALHQVGRADEARALLAKVPADAELEVEALEVLAADYGQLEGTGGEAFKRVKKLLLGFPKQRVLKVMQQLAAQEAGLTQWGALRFVDAEFAGQGLKLVELYLLALDAKDCTRRRIAARRLGELKATAAVEKLKALKAEPKRRGGVWGFEEEDCGQGAAGEALRRIEKGL